MVVQILILVLIAIIVLMALIACFSFLKSKTSLDHDSDESVFEDDNDGVQIVRRSHGSDGRRATFECEDLPLETFPMYRDIYVPIAATTSFHQAAAVQAQRPDPIRSLSLQSGVDNPPAYDECVELETTQV